MQAHALPSGFTVVYKGKQLLQSPHNTAKELFLILYRQEFFLGNRNFGTVKSIACSTKIQISTWANKEWAGREGSNKRSKHVMRFMDNILPCTIQVEHLFLCTMAGPVFLYREVRSYRGAGSQVFIFWIPHSFQSNTSTVWPCFFKTCHIFSKLPPTPCHQSTAARMCAQPSPSQAFINID